MAPLSRKVFVLLVVVLWLIDLTMASKISLGTVQAGGCMISQVEYHNIVHILADITNHSDSRNGPCTLTLAS